LGTCLTYWEPLGTQGSMVRILKSKKIKHQTLSPPTRSKNGPSWVHVESPYCLIGSMKNLLLKTLCHRFWPGLILLSKSRSTYNPYSYLLIHLSYQSNEVPSEFYLFFFTMSQSDWLITQKNETMEAPQNTRFYFEV